MDNGTFLSCWYARCWYARSAAVSGRPRCARYGLGRRSLTGGSHTHPTLAVAWAVFAANGGRTARALRAPSCARNAACGRQRHITPRHASPPRRKPRRVRPLLPRQARLRAHRSRRAPAPAPQPAPRKRFERPCGARNAACSTPRRISPGLSPAPSLRGLESRSSPKCIPNPATCAVDSAALRQQGNLTPAAACAEGKRVPCGHLREAQSDPQA